MNKVCLHDTVLRQADIIENRTLIRHQTSEETGKKCNFPNAKASVENIRGSLRQVLRCIEIYGL